MNEHADYVYLGKGRKVDQVKAEEPLAHEKFDVNGGQGINILYGDGHVEFLNMEDAQKLLAASAPK